MGNISLAELEDLIAKALVANRVSRENSLCVAKALAEADAAGLPSHGAARVPAYAGQARSGKVNGYAEPKIKRLSSACLQVDADSGFAFPAIQLGLEEAANRATETGVQLLNIANSHHSGALGLQMLNLAERGCIGLAFSNAPAAIAPAGGSKPLFGTNPIAFVSPRASAPPLMIDMSLSQVARGKVMLAANREEAIPNGWALDSQGQPTTDAQEALAGSMVAIGDSKGATLALMVELLCAALGNSHFAFQADSLFTTQGPPPRIAQTFIVIDPGLFTSGFIERTEQLLSAITDQQGTRIPSERRYSCIKTAQENGVSLDQALMQQLIKLAEN